jgi:hypothetical protein
LFATFTYLSDRTNNKHREKATKTLDLLFVFDRTDHNSHFGKLNLGSKAKFKTLNNSSLYLLILTWLRQLQEYFYNFEGGGGSASDWNKYGKYYCTPTPMKDAPLANINMAQKNGERTAVINVKIFEPDHRDGVCVSLEEWAARIFKPNSAGILRDAKLECKNTKHCFKRSKKVTRVFYFQGKTCPRMSKEYTTKKRSTKFCRCGDISRKFTRLSPRTAKTKVVIKYQLWY